VQVWLQGFSAGKVQQLVLEPNERLFFARTTGDWQLRETVQQVLDLLKTKLT